MRMQGTDTGEEAPLAPILVEWSRDLKLAAKGLTTSEARFLVDYYYTVQDYRIRTAGQIRSTVADEPNEVLNFLFGEVRTLEERVKSALGVYADSQAVGKWLLGIYGIGPVIASGLIAHIDITKAPTVGHIWRFAGLDPTLSWGKGEKRPWNAKLKVICWKAGESFVKFSGREECYYGKIYAERKVKEIAANERGDYKEQAAAALAAKRYGEDTQAKAAYGEGKLPPAHIHARAKRYAVKLLLSHLHGVWYEMHYGKPPPLPYPIAHLGHVDMIDPPNAA